MKPVHKRALELCGTAAVAGLALVVWLPMRGAAYATNGGFLGLGQRDFRVFDNFTAPTANDNVTPDPNFPGYTGATLAIWKACVEWGSRLHGNGNGDPHQPGGLGSGGANFDPVFQGEATGVGGTDDNIHSEISGSQGGVFAFTEVPGTDGWRIRYYQNWAWSDGPSDQLLPGEFDLQGVAAHEYGHALGLDHTNIAGATMQGSIQGNGVPQRSIEQDDVTGLAFVYVTAAPTKPVITGVATAPGSLTITGQNFAASGNEVWFTRATPSANVALGDPIKFTGVISTAGGTQISLGVPPLAGPGDVFVKVPGTAGSSLSNGWPADVTAGPACSTPSTLCTGAPNSVGAGARMAFSGGTYLSQNNLTLRCTGLRPGANAFFLAGRTPTQTPFGNGFLCVAGPTAQLPVRTADFFGEIAYGLNTQALPAGLSIAAGETWYFQCVYRDVAGGGALFNASDALLTTWCP
ncbi:MAG: matrixin family metalloprotease [Planctomycetes bacterium]|nr:matrixin family metalloprotease [Planctomycetota bacterium]